MEKQAILKALAEARKAAEGRKFTQSVDLIINLKDLDMKKDESKIQLFLPLPRGRGTRAVLAALISPEMAAKFKPLVDVVLTNEQFKALEKKQIKKLAEQTDFFIAQAPIMGQVASTFGRILGPRGKMPNPKAGCVILPNVDPEPICEKLRTTVKVETKNEPCTKALVGNEKMPDEDLAENISHVYTSVLHALPQERNNVKSVLVKLTMGKPIHIEH